jgi:UDP-2,4-diacetamido-2,4,6-trideoxy-beta-L-altropyranose hydrolase
MSPPRILFVVDAGARIGGGHVMRSLTLAQALEADGAACAFLAPPAAKAVLEAFGPEMGRLETGELTTPELVAAAADQARAFDAVVIDHYGLSAAEHRRIADGRPLLVLDDLADRPLTADLVLDSGPARQAEAYDPPCPRPGARRASGPGRPAGPAPSRSRRAAGRCRDGPSGRWRGSGLAGRDVGGDVERAAELAIAAFEPSRS